MRKITNRAVKAFYNHQSFKQANTSVESNEKGTFLYLYGNLIAVLDDSGLSVTTGGWDTLTTKDRLNGLEGVDVYTKRGQLHLNGNEWDGELTLIEGTTK